MGLFQELEGDVAVLAESGVYRQVPLYARNGHLYAKWGSGFVRLLADGSTTRARVRIEALMTDKVLLRDRFGRLCDGSVADAKPLAAADIQKLLGS